MIQDDDLPQPKKLRNLETLSVEELKNYIATLQEEIARAESMIAQKEIHKATAAAFFKTSGKS